MSQKQLQAIAPDYIYRIGVLAEHLGITTKRLHEHLNAGQLDSVKPTRICELIPGAYRKGMSTNWAFWNTRVRSAPGTSHDGPT